VHSGWFCGTFLCVTRPRPVCFSLPLGAPSFAPALLLQRNLKKGAKGGIFPVAQSFALFAKFYGLLFCCHPEPSRAPQRRGARDLLSFFRRGAACYAVQLKRVALGVILPKALIKAEGSGAFFAESKSAVRTPTIFTDLALAVAFAGASRSSFERGR
jgi:hypothetical protein